MFSTRGLLSRRATMTEAWTSFWVSSTAIFKITFALELERNGITLIQLTYICIKGTYHQSNARKNWLMIDCEPFFKGTVSRDFSPLVCSNILSLISIKGSSMAIHCTFTERWILLWRSSPPTGIQSKEIRSQVVVPHKGSCTKACIHFSIHTYTYVNIISWKKVVKHVSQK